jgi:hypothetical protein
MATTFARDIKQAMTDWNNASDEQREHAQRFARDRANMVEARLNGGFIVRNNVKLYPTNDRNGSLVWVSVPE